MSHWLKGHARVIELGQLTRAKDAMTLCERLLRWREALFAFPARAPPVTGGADSDIVLAGDSKVSSARRVVTSAFPGRR